jgi:hypothetical protein
MRLNHVDGYGGTAYVLCNISLMSVEYNDIFMEWPFCGELLNQ